MFTLEQITTAHSRFQSGAQYPKYVAELRRLGVLGYVYFVADGHTEYWGSGEHRLSSPPAPSTKTISEVQNASGFRIRLGAHQKGETTFSEFCSDCAEKGVARWVVDLSALTCTYFSREGAVMVVEDIPRGHSQ